MQDVVEQSRSTSKNNCMSTILNEAYTLLPYYTVLKQIFTSIPLTWTQHRPSNKRVKCNHYDVTRDVTSLAVTGDRTHGLRLQRVAHVVGVDVGGVDLQVTRRCRDARLVTSQTESSVLHRHRLLVQQHAQRPVWKQGKERKCFI